MGDKFNEEDMQAEQGEVEQQVEVEPPVAVKRPAEVSRKQDNTELELKGTEEVI